jgi:hypothetical protein
MFSVNTQTNDHVGSGRLIKYANMDMQSSLAMLSKRSKGLK